MKHKEDFVADKFYHIYNRANGSELLFRSDDNYTYFLKKYTQYVSPIADTYAYCLMPNHFHFLIQMKSEETLLDFFTKQGKDFQEDAETFRKAIFQQFSNLFNAYAKAYNKMYHRNGSLFQTALKRKIVIGEDYFTKLIHYIHSNPLHHGFVGNIEDWKFSSYQAFLNQKITLLERENVLQWFGDKDAFIEFHQQAILADITDIDL